MKYKVYTSFKDDRLNSAVKQSEAYFKDFPVSFSEPEYIKLNLKDKKLYETDLSLTFQELKNTKTIRKSYLSEITPQGYDGVILLVEKSKAHETSSLRGHQSFFEGKSLITVYCTLEKPYVKENKRGGKFYHDDTYLEAGSFMTQPCYTIVHEVLHGLANEYKLNDWLHSYIENGNFENFKTYLLNSRPQVTPTGSKLYAVAKANLNTDVTPKDDVPDNVACAQTLTTLISKVIDFPIIPGTSSLFTYLKKHASFTEVYSPQPGDVILSPTGYGNGKITGHCGVIGENGRILSNDSPTGLLKDNWTLVNWKNHYGVKGGLPVVYFRIK